MPNQRAEQNEQQIFSAFLTWLRERHATVMATEAEALRLLESGDTAAHRSHMQRKAELVASMCEDARPHLEGLPGPWRFALTAALEKFSRSASMGLRLGSIFYMSALLYPDDHQPGQPDNLQLCIERMAEQGQDFSG